MGAAIVGALATGASVYAARKATPKTTQENYNFGGDDPNDESMNPTASNTGFNAKRNDPMMQQDYLGTKAPVPGQDTSDTMKPIAAPWEKMISGIGNSVTDRFDMEQRMAKRFSGVR